MKIFLENLKNILGLFPPKKHMLRQLFKYTYLASDVWMAWWRTEEGAVRIHLGTRHGNAEVVNRDMRIFS